MEVISDSEDLITRLENDFKFFLEKNLSGIHISFTSYKRTPSLESHSRSWRYQDLLISDSSSIREVQYPEGGLLRFDFETNHGEVFATDINLLHELTYLGVLSRVGKLHDLVGLHRIHAMGVTNRKHAFVGIGDSGIGKSTTFLHLLERGFSFLSDDTVLIEDDVIRPFPIRVGLDKELGNSVTQLKRRRYGTKFLYDFSEKVASENHSDKIFILFKKTANNPRVRPARITEIYKYLFKYLVIGVGTPQVFELFWESGPRDFYIKTSIFLKRLRCAWKQLDKDFYVYETSQDQKSLDALDEFINSY